MIVEWNKKCCPSLCNFSDFISVLFHLQRYTVVPPIYYHIIFTKEFIGIKIQAYYIFSNLYKLFLDMSMLNLPLLHNGIDLPQFLDAEDDLQI
jgi:hypothetical protein